MIQEIRVWIAECDRCKKKYAYSDNEYDCFNTKKELIETIRDNDMGYGWKIKRKVSKVTEVLCEDCK